MTFPKNKYMKRVVAFETLPPALQTNILDLVGEVDRWE